MIEPHAKLLELAAKRHLAPEAQFASAADRLAAEAVIEVERLRGLLAGVQGVVMSMGSEVDDWPAYHRAIALGLSGGLTEASELFARLGSPVDPRPWEAERAVLCLELQRLLATPTEFRDVVVRLITQQRHTLRLPEIAEPITDTDLATDKGTAVH